jgi:pyroglutamyl-peptidase
MKPILLTCFEPFDGSPVNPSEQVACVLATDPPAGMDLHTATLPVDRHGAPSALLAALEATQPRAVLCLGEASRRPAVSIEHVAVNLMDYRIADNKGEQVSDLPVIPGAPAAYFSTLPMRRLLDALLAAGIPAELSLSAGAFLCNQIFFTLLHHLAENSKSFPAGFIHLPSLPQQAAAQPAPIASMSLETSVRAIRLLLEILKNNPD